MHPGFHNRAAGVRLRNAALYRKWAAIVAVFACVNAMFFISFRADTPAQDKLDGGRGTAGPLQAIPAALDFGIIKTPKRVEGTFELYNQADATITVSGMSKTCGCTTVNVATPFQLASREKKTVIVEVSLDESKSGRVNNTVTFLAGEQRLVVPVSALVPEVARPTFLPDVVDFGSVLADEVATVDLELTGVERQHDEPIVPALSDNSCSAQFARWSIDGSAVYTLSVRRDAARGAFNGMGVIQVRNGTARLHYRGRKVGNVACEDAVVVFREDKAGKIEPKEIVLRYAGDQQVDVTRLESDHDSMGFRLIDCWASGGKVVVQVAPDRSSPQARRGHMKLFTSVDPEPVAIEWFLLSKK